MERIEQIASEGHWLYTDLTRDDCVFAKKILRNPNSQPWAECTNEEKEQWEQEHPAPEVDNN